MIGSFSVTLTLINIFPQCLQKVASPTIENEHLGHNKLYVVFIPQNGQKLSVSDIDASQLLHLVTFFENHMF